MTPLGLWTKNLCAGEDQQQFSSQSVKTLTLKVLYKEVRRKGKCTTSVEMWRVSIHAISAASGCIQSSEVPSAQVATLPVHGYSSLPNYQIAQAVSRRLPTAAARVGSQVRSCGICSEQSGNGGGFLRVLQFPLQIPISPTHLSPGAGTIGQIVTDVPSGFGLTLPQEIKIIKKIVRRRN
jgi:hypothetical protein